MKSFAVLAGVIFLLFATPLLAFEKEPPAVVDVYGKFVGWPYSNSRTTQQSVERNINGVWVVLPVGHDGFMASSETHTVYFTSANCSGNQYMDLFALPLIADVRPNQYLVPPTTITFPGLPIQSLHIMSLRNSSFDCRSGDFGTFPVGPVQSVDIMSLGLTPPFTVKSRRDD